MKKVFLLLCFVLLFSNNVFAYTQMTETEIARAQEYGIMNYQKEIHDFAKSWVTYEEQSKILDTTAERAYVYTPYYLVAINARERLLSGQPINPEDGQIVINAFKGALPVNIVLHLENVDNIKDDLIATLQQRNHSVEAYAVDVQHVKVIQTKVIKVLAQPSEIPTETLKPSESTQKDDEKNKSEKIEEDKTKTEPKEDKSDKTKDKKADKKDKKKKQDKKQLYKKDDDAKTTPDKKPGKGSEQDKKEPKGPVYIDKTVPALYQVQLFCYFDSRDMNLGGQWVLLIDTPDERERRFNFSFSAMQ